MNKTTTQSNNPFVKAVEQVFAFNIEVLGDNVNLVWESSTGLVYVRRPRLIDNDLLELAYKHGYKLRIISVDHTINTEGDNNLVISFERIDKQ